MAGHPPSAMHNLENADMLSPKPSARYADPLSSLRRAVGDPWPGQAITSNEFGDAGTVFAANYTMAAAPKGGATFPAANLGLT